MWPARTARQQIRVTLIPQNLSKFYRSAIELTLDTGSPIHVYMNALFIFNTAYKKLLKIEKRENKCRYTPLCIQFRPRAFAQLRKVLLYELQVKLVFLFIPQTPLLPKRILLIRSIDNKVAYQSNVQLISFLSLVPIYSIIDKQPLLKSLLVSPVYDNVN